MDSAISRPEFNEFSKRVDEENHRQNRRIDLLEENVRRIDTMTTSIKEMSVIMKNMLSELEKQSERIEKLEKEPLETNKQVKNAIITAIVGAIVGAVVTFISMIMRGLL